MDFWVWSLGFGLLVRIPGSVGGSGFLGLDLETWVRIPGYGLLGLKSWIWSPGLDSSLGFLALESPVWNPGFGVLGFESWACIPGFGVLALDSWVLKVGLGSKCGMKCVVHMLPRFLACRGRHFVWIPG